MPKTITIFFTPTPTPIMEATEWRWGNEFFRKWEDAPNKKGAGALDPQKWENPRPDEVLTGIIKVNSSLETVEALVDEGNKK